MDRKINVLFMVSWYSAKGETIHGGIFHYEQAKSLNQYCNCAIYTPYDKTIQEFYSSDMEWGIRTFRTKYALEKKVRNRIYMIRSMKRIIREFHPDIIHAHVATEAGRFAVALGMLYHIPVIITEHSSSKYSGVDAFPHYYYAKFAYKYSKYNACVSDELTRNLKNIFPKYQFHTIYNGIPEQETVNGNEEEHFRKNGSVNAVIVAGFYDQKIKGHHILLPVIKTIVEEGCDLVLHVVGGGKFLEYYRDLASQLQLNDKCIFYGNCSKEKVYQIVSEMDFMISASLAESFGCAVAEGLMLGKPVVGTDCEGLKSIIRDETGIVVKAGDEKTLYDGVKKMMETYKGYDREKIKEYARENFEIHKISRKYMNIYEQILTNKKYKEREIR